MKRSRRMTLVAAAVILTMSACGDPDQTGSSATPGAGAPVVIQVAAADGGTKLAAPEAAAAGDAATSMMVAAMNFSFEGELPALGGEAPSWFFAADATPSTEQIAALAAAFGVSGDVVELPADQGGGWQVGSADYTGPSITVSKSATLDWWYSPGATSVAGSDGCSRPELLPATGEETVGQSPIVDAIDPTERQPATEATAGTEPAAGSGSEPATEPASIDPGVVDCADPQPPSGVPDAAAAEAAARTLLAAAGIDAAGYDFEVTADEWGAYVTAFLVVDGTRTPLSASFGFGAEAAVTWASGVLAAPQAGPAYPLQGATAGLEALQEQQNQWMGVSDAAGVKNDGAVSSGDAAVSSEAMSMLPCPEPALVDPAATEPVAESVPTDEPAVEPAPEVTVGLAPVDCAPIGPVDPIEVVLTGVEADLTLVWAEDGTVWLLPAYTFVSDDGGRYTVVAIDDAYLQTAAG